MSEIDDEAARRNHALWSHFQQHDRGVFTGAIPRLHRVAREVIARGGSSARVLTIGIGDGQLERSLRTSGCTVSALDPDDATVERLRRDGFDARQGVIETLPFGDASFDVVAASEVLEHLTQQQADLGLAEIARVLKPGGWLIGTVPYRELLEEQTVLCPHCGELFHRWGHCRSFDHETLRRDLEQHFGVITMQHRAYVAWKGRGPKRLVSGGAHWLLGFFGSSVAFPNIFFVARAGVSR